MQPLPVTELEIDDFLSAFEGRTLDKARFTHMGHLVVGACAVYRFSEDGAIAYLRAAIPQYNVAVGGRNTETSGYHETVTIFWVKLLERIRETAGPKTREEFVALVLKRFATERDTLAKFYDFDVVNSMEARQMWIAPNLRSL
jgi:hypothetical protein